MLETLTVDSFAPLVGDAFSLRPAGGSPFDAMLVEARSTGSAGSGRTRDPFALLFAGAVEPVHPQGLFAVEHPSFGALELLLVPVGRDERGVHYEAIFT